MATVSGFGVALVRARVSAGLTQSQLARALGKFPNTVNRWERRGTLPPMDVRITVLRLLADATRPLLATLAAEAEVDLVAIGLAPPAPAVVVAPPPVAVAPAIPAAAQATVDDALREAAEEIEVTPKTLRPALSRMLDRLARGGVPMDAAARMVLGVPKKEPKPTLP